MKKLKVPQKGINLRSADFKRVFIILSDNINNSNKDEILSKMSDPQRKIAELIFKENGL